MDKVELAVVAQPEEGKHEECDDEEKDLRDKAFDHARQDRLCERGSCGRGGLMPSTRSVIAIAKIPSTSVSRPVLRDMVFQSFYPSCHHQSFFPVNMNIPPAFCGPHRPVTPRQTSSSSAACHFGVTMQRKTRSPVPVFLICCFLPRGIRTICPWCTGTDGCRCTSHGSFQDIIEFRGIFQDMGQRQHPGRDDRVGNAAAEPLCTGHLVGMEELCKERTVNYPVAGTVSDIKDDHKGLFQW